MKNILVLGAGQSTPYLISYLLERAQKYDWFVTVADINPRLASMRVEGYARGQAITFDVNDAAARRTQLKKSDVVVNMLTRPFQYLLALECVRYNAHMLTASYEDHRMRNLETDAYRKNLLILNEMGLDPGIDHMSTMLLVNEIRERGGVVRSLKSYGSGLPAPDEETNPMRYVITWNPRNVLMAGEDGALYKEDGKIKFLPFHSVFQRSWAVHIEGIGMMEAYPNRDSLSYQSVLGLNYLHTIIRGTLRYPGWSETWQQIVYLGLANEVMTIPNLNQMTYRELTEMVLPPFHGGIHLEEQVANYLDISPTGKIMENLTWLGIFDDEKIGNNIKTAAEAMIQLIKRKLRMPEGMRDMVILYHELEAEYPKQGYRREQLRSTMVEYGDSGSYTAIAKTVGLPVAIATKLLLTGQIPLTGCHIPTHPAIYEPVMKELEELGITFQKTVQPIVEEEEAS